jgi:starch phosphorylase
VLSAAAFGESIQQHARYSLAQPWDRLSTHQIFECVSLAVRDVMVDRLLETERRYRQTDAKHLYYLSLEYLPGRFLASNLHNLGLYDLCRDTLAQMGVDLQAVEASEREPALGNGGLGRLAACVLTQASTGYTNHTLLPEALEKWPASLLERVVPRHLQIIYEINRRLLEHVASVWPGDDERLRRMSLIEEEPSKQVRMAHLAIVGSHSINGVSALHSRLVRTTLAPDFYRLWPERFNNKTNGVTPRRWLVQANPGLARLITRRIGDGWITNLAELRALEPWASDGGFRDEFLAVKRANKERLARVIAETTGVVVDPASLFDVQVKRIHEYKRQLLKVMHIVHEYLCLIEDGTGPIAPRTYVFAGKAAPGYRAAKRIINTICSVGAVINDDPRVAGQLRVVFVPDYGVSLAQRIIPAADLSEQISTAGTEASGTGNMKLAMNGALTIGTLDGANVELLAEVGAENLFIFGLTTEEIHRLRAEGSYRPRDLCAGSPRLQRIFDAFASDLLCPGEPGRLRWINEAVLDRGDVYFHVADLPGYLDLQQRVSEEFSRPAAWVAKAIRNVARIGRFSSDRMVAEYAREIWHIQGEPSC